MGRRLGFALCLAALLAGEAAAERTCLAEMMDLSRETGPKPAEAGWTRTCGQNSWRALNVVVPSRLTVPLGGGAVRFTARAALSDFSEGEGVCLRLTDPDGKVLWEKSDVRKGQEHPVDVSLRGLDGVVFEATGPEGAKASWVDATFAYADGKLPPNDVRHHSRQLGVLTPKPSPRPRVNGASVIGVRPGHPILYRVPVTGEKVKVKVRGEGEGWTFDPETRVLGGAIATCGDCVLTVVATNAFGRDEKKLTIRVGEAICLTPAMGWNSWNSFGDSVTDEKVRGAADALVASGLADHGWQYVNVDDFWQDKKKFPDMKGLADHIHAKGLKAGIYSSPGPTTCGGNPGSWGHVEEDAKAYADWGYDFLKYDLCSYGGKAFGEGHWRWMHPYAQMGRALRAQKRDIVYSLCEYGKENPSAWGHLVGGQSWRVTGDVFDTWASISGAIERLKRLFPYSRPGAWNDPDMLCVGRVCWDGFKPTRLAPNEQYTHLSLWALAAAPLMIGCDLTRLDEFTYSLLTNDEVIDIDQDPLGLAAGCVAEGEDWEIWARPLADGSIAAGLYNKSLEERTITLEMEKLGILCKWKVRDVWRQEDEGVFLGSYDHPVPGHATHLIRLTPLKCGKLREGLRDIRDNAWELLMRRDACNS